VGKPPWNWPNSKPFKGLAIGFSSNVGGKIFPVLVTKAGNSYPLAPSRRSVSMWLYTDGNCCSWGHRHAGFYWLTLYKRNQTGGSPRGAAEGGISLRHFGPGAKPGGPVNQGSRVFRNSLGPSEKLIPGLERFSDPIVPGIGGLNFQHRGKLTRGIYFSGKGFGLGEQNGLFFTRFGGEENSPRGAKVSPDPERVKPICGLTSLGYATLGVHMRLTEGGGFPPRGGL